MRYAKKIEISISDPSKNPKVLQSEIDDLIKHIIEVQKHLSVMDRLLEERKDLLDNGNNPMKHKETSLSQLGLSARVMNILYSYDINTIEDLKSKTKKDLIVMRGMGVNAIKEIEQALENI